MTHGLRLQPLITTLQALQVAVAVALVLMVPLGVAFGAARDTPAVFVAGITGFGIAGLLVATGIQNQAHLPTKMWWLPVALLIVSLGASFTDIGVIAGFWNDLAILGLSIRTLSWGLASGRRFLFLAWGTATGGAIILCLNVVKEVINVDNQLPTDVLALVAACFLLGPVASSVAATRN